MGGGVFLTSKCKSMSTRSTVFNENHQIPKHVFIGFCKMVPVVCGLSKSLKSALSQVV